MSYPIDPEHWYREILDARAKAHQKHKASEFGSMETMPPDRPSWLAILIEEVGEVARALTYDGSSDLRAELIDVLAVATAWIDRIDGNEGVVRDIEDRATMMHFSMIDGQPL